MTKELPPFYRVAVSDLIPYARNARTHSDLQVAQIAASIREFGFNNPVLIEPDKTIIAGHGRVLAAQKLQLEDVPCIELAHLTEDQKRAFILADNKLALNAGWDAELLALEFDALTSSGFNLEFTGFDTAEIGELLSTPFVGNTDPDEVPEITENPISKQGDIWILGSHRLMCGDSTKSEDISKLCEKYQPDMCFTSPPYGNQRDYENNISDWLELMCSAFGNIPTKENANILVNMGLIHKDGMLIRYWDAWLDDMAKNHMPVFAWYVWDKLGAIPGNWNGRLGPSHEFIFHFNKGNKGQANKWVEKDQKHIKRKKAGGLRKKNGEMGKVSSPDAGLNTHKISDSVIRVTAQQTENTGHPAGFPVALCEEMLFSFASVGDVIYEPFSGSGTNIIACEKNGYSCYAMEIAPKYCDIAIKRWQKFTGKKAMLEETGEFFDKLVETGNGRQASTFSN